MESYLGVYPENLKEIVFQKKAFTFFDNTETVKSRQQKYILENGLVRQLHAVVPDNAKREMIKKRALSPHLVRTEYGKGEIYQTALANKLLCLLVNKLASLDPFGIGMEMEAGKPNWFDALNGLPALCGSSINETFELKRLIIFIKGTLQKTGVEKIDISEEIHDFLTELDKLIVEYFNGNSSERDFRFWNKSHSLKEDYAHKTRFGFSGKETELDSQRLNLILNNALRKINQGLKKAYDKKRGLYCAYFINAVAEYEILKDHFIKPTRFRQKKLPLYLEGQVHALKMVDNLRQAKILYQAIRKSQLYDKKLKMYKVTASLKDMPEEIGRCRIFTPGWLENESIWLHMEYKYLLEILKCGLHKEFYEDFKNCLIPFQKPKVYGRSILENSSFIVSSVFPDKNLHGNGFEARLSGSTAEFIHIWLMMNAGIQPFRLNEKGELILAFSPILPRWLFKKDNTYSFKFLGKVSVTYHNPRKKDTFGENAVRPRKINFSDKDNRPVEIASDTIPSLYALQIRSGLIKQIDIHLG